MRDGELKAKYFLGFNRCTVGKFGTSKADKPETLTF